MKKKLSPLLIIGIILLIGIGAGIYFFMQPPATPSTSGNENPTGSPSGTTPEGTPIQTHNIELRSFTFSPSTLTIQPGDTVIWTNYDSSEHTITSDTGNELASELFSKGETYSHTFNTIGTFDYHCGIHPSMKGTIIVE